MVSGLEHSAVNTDGKLVWSVYFPSIDLFKFSLPIGLNWFPNCMETTQIYTGNVMKAKQVLRQINFVLIFADFLTITGSRKFANRENGASDTIC